MHAGADSLRLANVDVKAGGDIDRPIDVSLSVLITTGTTTVEVVSTINGMIADNNGT